MLWSDVRGLVNLPRVEMVLAGSVDSRYYSSHILQSIVTFSHLLNDHLVQLKFALYFYRFMIIPHAIFRIIHRISTSILLVPVSCKLLF